MVFEEVDLGLGIEVIVMTSSAEGRSLIYIKYNRIRRIQALLSEDGVPRDLEGREVIYLSIGRLP